MNSSSLVRIFSKITKDLLRSASTCQSAITKSDSIAEAPAGRLMINDAKLSSRHLQLTWSAGKTSLFPFSWLRDNCQCPNCFHPVSESRTVDWAHCDVTKPPKHVQVSDDGMTVTMQWEDAHSSQYSTPWLHARRFEKDAQDKWLETYKQRKHIWGSTLDEQFPRVRFNYKSLVSNDSSLLEWLLELERRGVALIEGAPEDEGSARRLAERVAFIRRTHYGEEFSVKAKTDPSNVAYTGQPLQLHTDLPYYDYKPGVNILHCLVQSEGEGGANQLVDTLRVASLLKASHPHYYKALASTLVDWSDVGQEGGKHFRSLYRAPVICEDWSGDIVRVNYSQPQRDSHFTASMEQVEQWYLALRQFTKLMLMKENCVNYKLTPGEVLTFDNLRICHGRSGYHPAANMILERHLVGAYLDWDEIRSRIRVLQR